MISGLGPYIYNIILNILDLFLENFFHILLASRVPSIFLILLCSYFIFRISLPSSKGREL